MESAEYECDCPGPPPEFRLPPPPRPPFLQEPHCSEAPLLAIEACDALPVIDAELHSSPAIPSIAVIAVSSLVLLLMVLIVSVLVWKHKRKISQNLLPCKSSPQSRCEVAAGNGVIYEDLTNMRPRPLPSHTAPSIEMLDVKTVAPSAGSPVFICPPERYTSQDLYNPVYEELSNGSGEEGDSEVGRHRGSDDEFAEDELSLGDAPNPLHRHKSLQHAARKQPPPPPPRHGTLPPGAGGRRRGPGWRGPPDCGEFHEGLLLDALLQQLAPPSGRRVPYVVPYEAVPVVRRPPPDHCFSTFRPPAARHDAAAADALHRRCRSHDRHRTKKAHGP